MTNDDFRQCLGKSSFGPNLSVVSCTIIFSTSESRDSTEVRSSTTTGRSSTMTFQVHLPSSYADVRPHHVLALYMVLAGVSASGLYKKVANGMLALTTRLSNCLMMPLAYKGALPDFLSRMGLRLQIREQLHQASPVNAESAVDTKMIVIHQLKAFVNGHQNGHVPEDENEPEVIELPTALYGMCLGPAKKYSAGLWPKTSTTLAESETNMLQLYCQRAGVMNGMHIVDLGCGAGSLTLFIAEKYPACQITGISNNAAHRRAILKAATAKNLTNIRVITCDVADDNGALNVVRDMDLVMTVELMGHMKHYEKVMSKVQGFLKPGGKLFVQAETHKDFSLGDTPSDDLMLYCCKGFHVVDHWRLNGSHYAKSAAAWLVTLDASWKKGSLKPILAFAYGNGKEKHWHSYWRTHFLRLTEQWGLNGGEEYIISHYLFQRG